MSVGLVVVGDMLWSWCGPLGGPKPRGGVIGASGAAAC